MSIDRWMDKEAEVHIYNAGDNGILLSHKKECIWVSANEVNEPRAYYTEWNKSEEKKYIFRAYWIMTNIVFFKVLQQRLTWIKYLYTNSKFSKPGFSNTWTVNFQMFKLVLEKVEEPDIKLPTSPGSSKKQESSRKTSISALLTMPKPLTAWITINCGKFWKRWEYQTTWPASWETCMQVRKQQLELDMEQQTGFK